MKKAKNKYFRFEKLDVWNKALSFSKLVYKLSDNFPKKEMYALTDQLRRAVVSISLNIAEGSGHNSDKAFVNYLMHSRGSLYETITCLKLA